MSKARTLADLGEGIQSSDLPDITADKLDVGQIGGRRNIAYNGSMQIAQRGTSTTGITSGASYYTADRWNFSVGSAGTWTASQSTDAPDGFSNSFKLECTTSSSLSSGSLVVLQQAIEGQDLQRLKKGTANAEPITVSFWVKSAKTGTHIFEIYDIDNARQVSNAYTINTADTWEHKTITIDGDTVGSLDNDNNASLWFVFWLAAGTAFTSGTLSDSWTANTNANRVVGQVNLADTNNNDWYVTGVQLEVGTVATPFEHRSYGEELALCQRYYEKFAGLLQYSKAREADRLRYINFFYKQVKRATPDITLSGTADGTSFANFADNSLDGFRGQCVATGDGATPFFTSATFNSEL